LMVSGVEWTRRGSLGAAVAEPIESQHPAGRQLGDKPVVNPRVVRKAVQQHQRRGVPRVVGDRQAALWGPPPPKPRPPPSHVGRHAHLPTFLPSYLPTLLPFSVSPMHALPTKAQGTRTSWGPRVPASLVPARRAVRNAAVPNTTLTSLRGKSGALYRVTRPGAC